MEQSFFPIHTGVHIVLALLAFLVFGLQFIRYRKSHHLILAIALPCTLLPYLSDNSTFFYTVGAAEGVALLLALIFSQTIDRGKKTESADKEQPEGEEQA